MAKVIELMNQIPAIIEQIYINHRKADELRDLEYKSAVKIQSWYRGIRVRAYIKYLRSNAIKIQRTWRGYLGRSKYRSILQERVKQMRLEYYNKKAILVQKLWRGYYSRKYIFNYYKRKAYLIAIQQKERSGLKRIERI